MKPITYEEWAKRYQMRQLQEAASELLATLESLASAAARIIEDDDKPKLVHMTELNRQRRAACEIIARAEGREP